MHVSLDPIGSFVQWSAFLWSGTLFGLTVTVLLLRWGLRSPRIENTAATSPWLLIRPCAGLEPTLDYCLKSVADAQICTPLEVILVFAAEEDPAIPTAKRVAETLNQRGITTHVYVAANTDAPNQKASMLGAVLDRRDGELVFCVDSNIDLTGFDLDALGRRLLSEPKLGAVWVPHAESRQHNTLGSSASEAVIGGSLHAFSLLCALDPRGLVGKLFALRPTGAARRRWVSTLGRVPW